MLLGVLAPVFVYNQETKLFAYVESVGQDAQARTMREWGARVARKVAMDTSEERAQLDQLAIGKDAAAVFIEWVESRARAAHVKLDIGSVGASGDGILQSFSMTMHANGTYAQVMQFLMLLETAPQAEKIDSVILDHGENGWTVTTTLHAPIQTI